MENIRRKGATRWKGKHNTHRHTNNPLNKRVCICSIGNSMPGSCCIILPLHSYGLETLLHLFPFDFFVMNPKKVTKCRQAHIDIDTKCVRVFIFQYYFLFCLHEFCLLWVERRTSCFFIRKAFRNRFRCVSLNPGSDLNIHFPIRLNNLRYWTGRGAESRQRSP